MECWVKNGEYYFQQNDVNYINLGSFSALSQAGFHSKYRKFILCISDNVNSGNKMSERQITSIQLMAEATDGKCEWRSTVAQNPIKIPFVKSAIPAAPKRPINTS